MRLVIGSDHAGKTLRLSVLKYLQDNNYEVFDVGTENGESVDYPHYAERVAAQVAAGEADLGILVCGTGIGMSMAANRVRGVRAALCTNEWMATMARAHNQANVLCLGERIIGDGLAMAIVQAFLDGRFEGGRHARRVEQLTDLEKKRT